jgi:hypothetical protein
MRMGYWRPTGVFYWQPGPGFLGHYEFVFMRTGGEQPRACKNRAKEVFFELELILKWLSVR